MQTSPPSSLVLKQVRQRLTQAELAEQLEVSPRTVARWESGETELSNVQLMALKYILKQPETAASSKQFTFIDLFAGIGGMRLGFEANGGQCIFTSEWNKHSQKTYSANFADGEPIAGDITQLTPDDIPDHDVLVAGFPCQPFSIAGVSKKNSLGNPHGFECKTQGTLFFDVARMIQAKRPKAFLLENVKNLERHDKGKTFSVIMDTLQRDLKYNVSYRVIDAKHFLPQHRERIFIVGFADKVNFDWSLAQLPEIGIRSPRLNSILHSEDGSETAEPPFTSGKRAEVSDKYTLTDHLWQYLQDYAAKHKAMGNGFGFGLVGPKDTARTLSARYYKDGSEILISQGKRKNPRRLTPRECARLMGFPDSYKIPVSDTQAYMQFGNSVAVPVVAEVARLIKLHLLGATREVASKQETAFGTGREPKRRRAIMK